MTTTIRGYTTYGDIRGGCGRLYRTEDAARRATARDARRCERQGGYSDRIVCAVGADGVLYYDDSCEFPVWPSHGRSCGAVRFVR